MYNVFVVAVNLGMLLVELLAVSSYKFSTSVYSYLTIMLFPEAKVLVIFSFVCKEILLFFVEWQKSASRNVIILTHCQDINISIMM